MTGSSPSAISYICEPLEYLGIHNVPPHVSLSAETCVILSEIRALHVSRARRHGTCILEVSVRQRELSCLLPLLEVNHVLLSAAFLWNFYGRSSSSTNCDESI